MKQIRILLTVLTITLLAACDRTTCSGSYKPPLIPITITVDSNLRVSIKWSPSISTPIGVFSIGVSVALTEPDTENDVIVVVRRDGVPTEAYKVHGDAPLQVTTVVGATFTMRKNHVDIDIHSPPPSAYNPSPPRVYSSPSPPLVSPPPAAPAPGDGETAIVDYRRDDDHANLRSGPSRYYAELADVPKGSRVILLGESRRDEGVDPGRWYRVSFDGMVGWLHQNSLKREQVQ